MQKAAWLLQAAFFWVYARRLLACSAFLQNFKRGQGFAFQHFQEGTAAGGDVAHLVLDAVFGNGGQGVATTGNAEGFRFGNRLGDGLGATGKLVELDAFSGKMLNYAVLDTNSDNLVDSNETISSGVIFTGGIPTLNFISSDGKRKGMTDTSATITNTVEKGGGGSRRIMWRPIQEV